MPNFQQLSDEYTLHRKLLSKEKLDKLGGALVGLKKVLGSSGPDRSHGDALDYLRKHGLKGDEAAKIMEYAGLDPTAVTVPDELGVRKAAAIKFLRHLYLQGGRDNQQVWVLATPSAYTGWPSAELAAAKTSHAQIKTKLAEAKDLSFRTVGDEDSHAKDRLVVMVRDPYWLHAYWELSRRSIERAEAAMGQYWHGARPVLRLHQVSRNGTTNAARQPMRDIEIHGGVNNWYIDVQNPPKSYQLEIGYLAIGGRFYSIARSNLVSTPSCGSAESFDRNWAEVAKEYERIYAMTTGSTEQDAGGDLKDVFEEQLHRTVGDPLATQFGPGAAGPAKEQFRFQIDTELIVHGVTHPDARVTLRGEPVRLRSDGTFAVRFSLPDRRHVLPVVASSGDGAEQRTIVLAVDRNTKVMESVTRDASD